MSFAMPRDVHHDMPVPRRSLATATVVAVLVSIPVLSLVINAFSWFRYGVDLPYADDWRTYRDGTAYSLNLRDLFTPANDTLYPVGRALDALAMRYLAGNSVAYQFISMIAVLGGLLWLQWHLLVRVLRDRVLAASAFTLTLFMLQPDTYWGLQNLAYHQAIPLLCTLWILAIAISDRWRSFWGVPALFVLGFVSGLTYISGAFATLVLSGTLLVFALLAPQERRRHATAGIALLVPGLVCIAAQIWVILSVQKGQISGKIPWAMPYQMDFWAYMMGKFGRALLLPAGLPQFSIAVTAMALVTAAVIALVLSFQLLKRRLSSEQDIRIALVFLSLLAVVFVYMLLVAAGRTNLRPDTISRFQDIFAFGFLRFHFFWATILWPWVGAAILLWLSRRPARSVALSLGAAFLIPALAIPAVIRFGGFDHSQVYKEKMDYRLENEVGCLQSALRQGDAIVCPVMVGSDVDLFPAYDFARRHGASFTRYFSSPHSSGAHPSRLLEDGPVLKEPTPAGEIQKDSSIVQTIVLNDEARGVLSQERVCLRLFLGTYARANEGRAEIVLAASQRSWRFELPFASLADNQFHELCGAGTPATTDEKGASSIRIQGIEGREGHVPTVWLTSDTTFGTAIVDGRDTGRSLVFNVVPASTFANGTYGILAYVLCAAVLALCFVAMVRNGQSDPDHIDTGWKESKPIE